MWKQSEAERKQEDVKQGAPWNTDHSFVVAQGDTHSHRVQLLIHGNSEQNATSLLSVCVRVCPRLCPGSQACHVMQRNETNCCTCRKESMAASDSTRVSSLLQGQKAEAEKYYLRAIQLDPTKGNCYMHYGMLWLINMT